MATVTVAPDAATLFTGGSATLSATLRDAAGNTLSGRTISWTSANPNVATVTAAGIVTGVGPGGPVAITATSEGKSGTAEVTVLAPVASVTVAPGASSLIVGGSTTLTATPRDAGNNVLTGRTITWASSDASRVTVSPSGVVTAVAPGGPVTITATCEGQSGNAQVTVLAPVTSVIITGATRTKVGDSYAYTATARLADGTVVNRPATWSVSDPSRGNMTPSGTLTPLQTGVITLRVTIDGVVWEGTTTAYDWFAFGSGTTFGVAVNADIQVTNKFGASEYPQLALGCSGGLFLLFVDTDNFVTENGLVAYRFDNLPIEGATWLEFDLFSALAHPGPDNATRTFANRMGAAAQFGFAFTEFNASAKATLFRVTGLASRLPAFTTCPVASPPSTASAPADPRTGLLASTGRGSAMTAERALRGALRSAGTTMPELRRSSQPHDTQAAIRRW